MNDKAILVLKSLPSKLQNSLFCQKINTVSAIFTISLCKAIAETLDPVLTQEHVLKKVAGCRTYRKISRNTWHCTLTHLGYLDSLQRSNMLIKVFNNFFQSCLYAVVIPTEDKFWVT